MGQQSKASIGGRARWKGARFRYLVALACASAAGVFLISTNRAPSLLLFARDEAGREAWDHRPRPQHQDTFTIDTEGCTIPGLEPFDENIKKFIIPPTVGPCRNENLTLLQHKHNYIWVQKEFLRYHGVDEDNITCCYKSFFRPASVADITSQVVDSRVTFKPCVYFTNHIVALHEFVKVECAYILPNSEIVNYKQYFLFAQNKPILKRELIDNMELQIKPSYNVIIMGLDAISRLNFHRTMPKTLAYLQKKGAIELLGYNKVGDNSFPNLIPLLLGFKETELMTTCWPHSRATFDNCPFLWERFKAVNYYTALGEDNAKLGTFNSDRLGFIGTPTDYYLHTFMVEAEGNDGNNLDFNCYLCMGSKYFYKVLLDYVQDLTQVLKSSRLFGFFWEASMSHDYLNYPMFMDNSYEKFLENLDSFNYLDETIIIFVSDHGIRWGDIRYTKQGRLEERLPLAHILLPQSFQVSYPLAFDNLKINSRRLTTPFDLHATLLDLITMSPLLDINIKQRSNTSYGEDRGISLFLPVPTNRTCEMAAIDEHWCTCHKRQKTMPDSQEAREAALFLVTHLNTLVQEHKQCARLKLGEVIEVTELIAGRPGNKEEGWSEFVTVVRVQPGGGVFEATLRRHKHGWALAGAVSRLNLYGNQSHCAHHYRLKLYCYCL